MVGKGEAWHRRHALHLAAQLPENPEDALMVLDCARELVEKFLAPSFSAPAAPDATLLSFSKGRRLQTTAQIKR